MTDPLEIKIDKYTFRRDKYNRWIRLRLPEEMTHPNCFKEFGLEDTERALIEEIVRLRELVRLRTLISLEKQ